MPRKAKQRRWNKKKQADDVKKFKKTKSKIKKISHTKEDGYQYNEYIAKTDLKDAWENHR